MSQEDKIDQEINIDQIQENEKNKEIQILEKQIKDLEQKLVDFQKQHALDFIEKSNQRVEISNLKAQLDVQTSAPKNNEVIEEYIDENDLSKVLAELVMEKNK